MSEFNLGDIASVIAGVARQCYRRIFGRTKAEQKEQELKLADLEAEVARLSYGNEVLQGIIPAIVQAILDYARTQGERIRIEGDTVYYITGNTGGIHLSATMQSEKSPRRPFRRPQDITEAKRAGGLPPSELGD